MSTTLTLKLTGRQADALHTVLAVILNDPFWFDGNTDEHRAVAEVDDKLVAELRKATT